MSLRAYARAFAVGCALAAAAPALAPIPALAGPSVGLASFYGPEAKHPTANGERFIPDSKPGHHTCASWHYPFNTRLHVTRLDTGKSLVCRVNDRGPAEWTGKILDLSRGAGRELGILRRGYAKVRIRQLGR